MESVEEIITCKICMEHYNDSDKKPLFITCGHTFCSHCLRFIFKRSIVHCPLDKKQHKYDTFAAIPTNFSVLNCLHSYLLANSKSGNQSNGFAKKCAQHPSENLKFYCENHEVLIC